MKAWDLTWTDPQGLETSLAICFDTRLDLDCQVMSSQDIQTALLQCARTRSGKTPEVLMEGCRNFRESSWCLFSRWSWCIIATTNYLQASEKQAASIQADSAYKHPFNLCCSARHVLLNDDIDFSADNKYPVIYFIFVFFLCLVLLKMAPLHPQYLFWQNLFCSSQ